MKLEKEDLNSSSMYIKIFTWVDSDVWAFVFRRLELALIHCFHLELLFTIINIFHAYDIRTLNLAVTRHTRLQPPYGMPNQAKSTFHYFMINNSADFDVYTTLI